MNFLYNKKNFYHNDDEFETYILEKYNPLIFKKNIGNLEREVLNELQKYTKINIQRNPQKFGYFPDGLIEKNNLKIDIEFDENFHESLNMKNHDKIRDLFFISNNYIVVRIKESEWLEDSKLQIIKLQETIKFLEQIQELN